LKKTARVARLPGARSWLLERAPSQAGSRFPGQACHFSPAAHHQRLRRPTTNAPSARIVEGMRSDRGWRRHCRRNVRIPPTNPLSWHVSATWRSQRSVCRQNQLPNAGRDSHFEYLRQFAGAAVEVW